MPETIKNKTIPKQTHLNRVPLKNGIIQAPHPCKQQMNLSDPNVNPAIGRAIEHPGHIRDMAGFYARATNPSKQHSTGRTLFCIDIKHKGHRHYKLIGYDTEMTIDTARSVAAIAIASLKTGQTSRLILANEMKFGVFATEFLARYRHNWKPVTYAGSRRALDAYILPWFVHYDIRDIIPDDVRGWFAALRPTPGAANRSLPLLSVMMREAERYGYRHEGTNPCKGISRYKLKTQDRFLRDDEYRNLGMMLADQESITPLRVAMVRLLLLTGCRKSEIRTLKWCYYRAGVSGKRHLFLPDSKSGPKTVYLSDPARAILDQLPRKSLWVFPSTIKRKRGRPRKSDVPFFDIEFWTMFRKRANLHNVRLHDLRHSYASFAIRNAVGITTLGRLLGHADPETTLRYTHLGDDTLAAAAQVIAAALDGSLGDVNGGEVSE